MREFCTASAVLSSCRVVHSVSRDSVAVVFIASVKVQGLSLHSASSLVMIASISATKIMELSVSQHLCLFLPISSFTDSKVMLSSESMVPLDGITLLRPLKEFLTAEDKVFLFIFCLNLWSYFFSE